MVSSEDLFYSICSYFERNLIGHGYIIRSFERKINNKTYTIYELFKYTLNKPQWKEVKLLVIRNEKLIRIYSFNKKRKKTTIKVDEFDNLEGKLNEILVSLH